MLQTSGDFHGQPIADNEKMLRYREKSKVEKGNSKKVGNERNFSYNQIQIDGVCSGPPRSGCMSIDGKTISEYRLLPVFLIHTFNQMPKPKRIHLLLTCHYQTGPFQDGRER